LGSGGITPIIPKMTLERCNYLHASAPLTLGKVPQYPLTDRLGDPKLVWMLQRKAALWLCHTIPQFSSLQTIQCTDYHIYTAWEELNEVLLS